ncbi:hypothetical protein DIE00_34115 [Burkholderia sp. Bp8989]|nr:hypothetical protein DIE05_29970 [Burkholderia sp. Bp8995]RQS39239.1 hypothetical protein DIE00_34115 [Burkholderia sp. Bp8989]
MSTPAGAWKAHAGAAFLAPSGPNNYLHLFVILNDPIPFPNRGSQPCVCVVNFSTPPKALPYDQTCVFRANCHPFIKHDSFVYYRMARDLFARDVEANIASGIWTLQPPDFSAVDVQTLTQGLFNSPHTPRDLKSLKI